MNKYLLSSVDLLKTTATFALFASFAFQASAMNSDESLNRSGFVRHHSQSEHLKDEKTVQGLLTNVYNYHAGNGVKQLINLGERDTAQILEMAASLVLKGVYEKPDTLPLIHAWEAVTGKGWAQGLSTQSLLTNVYNYHAGNNVKQLVDLSEGEKVEVIETATSLILNKTYKQPNTTPLIHAWEMITKKPWHVEFVGISSCYFNYLPEEIKLKAFYEVSARDAQALLCVSKGCREALLPLTKTIDLNLTHTIKAGTYSPVRDCAYSLFIKRENNISHIKDFNFEVMKLPSDYKGTDVVFPAVEYEEINQKVFIFPAVGEIEFLIKPALITSSFMSMPGQCNEGAKKGYFEVFDKKGYPKDHDSEKALNDFLESSVPVNLNGSIISQNISYDVELLLEFDAGRRPLVCLFSPSPSIEEKMKDKERRLLAFERNKKNKLRF